VAGLLCVPPGGRLRMIWAGVEDRTGRMAELHGRLEAGLEGLGLPREGRAFRPHITMGRVTRVRQEQALRRQAEALAGEEFGTVEARHVVVFTSDLTPRGPTYTPVAHAPLG